MPSKNIKGKIIVITGASSGFGKGMARKFAEAGANLVLAARRSELLKDLAAECQALGVEALAIPTDVSNPTDIERLYEKTLAKFGHFDVWINDAGIAALGRFEEIPIEDHLKVIGTNVNGVICGTHFALRHYRRQRAGIVINISSALGKIPAPYYASYVASKHAVVGLDSAIRQELRENDLDDVHVCTVMPMSNDTPFFDHAANYTGHVPMPIPPLYDPQEVIDKVFDLVTDPEDEVTVGAIGKMMVGVHGVAPESQEKIMGKQAHKTQMKDAAAAAPSTGSLHQPQTLGSDVYGGRLAK